MAPFGKKLTTNMTDYHLPRRPALLLLVAFVLTAESRNSSLFSFSHKFRRSSHKLIDYLVKFDGKNSGYKWLEPLVDDFGARHVGSTALEDAIDFTSERLKADGFDNVHTEKVDGLPHWIRGDDQAIMIKPRSLRLNILAVGSVQPAEVIAPVVVVSDLDELEDDRLNVRGKIVLFAEEWHGYGRTVRYRNSAAMLEKRGAVGVLVRSIAPFSLSTPHTGSAREAGIPTLCTTVEEAELLSRLYKRGKEIVIYISVKSGTLGTTSSRNTIFEIRGSTWPNEVVLLSGHMDSWDVGQGALDDGGGMAAVWQAMNAIRQLAKDYADFVPKRTIRGIFWTSEEQGFRGSNAYYDAHRSNVSESYFFVSETDQGAFRPTTYHSQLQFMGSEKHKKKLEEIVHLLNSYGIPLAVVPNKSQGDVSFWANDGVPSANYVSEKGIDYYFYFHHTNADYLNVFEEGDIDYTAAVFGVLAHVLSQIESWD